MAEKKSSQLAGKTLEHSPHVCAFFNTREEEYQVLLPFIKSGFEEGDKAFHIVDPRHLQDHLQRLHQVGINVEETTSRGQLEVREWGNTCLREGRFDQDKMLELVDEVLTECRSDGFALTRFVDHMEWSLEDFPGVYDLVEYESRLNYLAPKYEDPILCTYDISRFSAEVVMDILRVHPMVIIGGILHENPFYTPPEDFLKVREEITSRKLAHAEVAELRGQLSESREAERLLRAQELHDGPIQDLFALSYKLEALSESAQMTQVKPMQEEVMQVVGTLRRLCEELRPSTLLASGLEESILSHLEQFKQQYPAYRVQTEFQQNGTLPERISLALYRIYQQALANIVRHAQADEIFVGFRVENNHAVLEVRDNGRGLIVPGNWLEFARQGHLGLIGSFERAEAVGGKVIVASTPGQGTKILVKVPLEIESGKSVP